jgi:hypothetical protein
VLGVILALGLAALMIFGMSFVAAVQSKSLFTASEVEGEVPAIVTRDGHLVAVAESKIAVPLGLAPFLSSEQLRDIQIVGYYDCQAQEEIWGRVISVRRYFPAEHEPSEEIVQESVPVRQENMSNASQVPSYSVTFILETGRSLVVDSEGEFIDFPEENRTQELCGELQCAQLHLDHFDLEKLEQHAAEVLGDTIEEDDEGVGRRLRRLQRGRQRNRGRRGGRCRRCNRPPQRPRRNPRPTPGPAPSACSAVPSTSSPVQAATVQVAQAICQQVSAAGSSAGRADVLGGVVRLAFHDAGSFDGSTGGADGCVDLAHVSNRGLQPVIASLESIVQAVSGTLSRADVWALAATVAIEAAGGPQLTFRFGRIDSASCSGHGPRHPDAEGNHVSIRADMVDRLGFSERAVSALMGAHVLGRAVTTNSGYNGAWVRQADRFTNRYFRDLLVVPWNRRALPDFEGSSRTQWNGPGNTMMLNTDIEIAFDTGASCNRAGGRPRGGGRCPRAEHGFSDAVTEFATNQDAFFEEFAPAFQRLVNLGSSSLQCAFADCSTPGPL